MGEGREGFVVKEVWDGGFGGDKVVGGELWVFDDSAGLLEFGRIRRKISCGFEGFWAGAFRGVKVVDGSKFRVGDGV